MLSRITSFLITRVMAFNLKIKRQEVSSWAGLLISDISCEWYYHIGTPYLDSSLQSELLFKEKKKQTKRKLLCLWNRFWKVFKKVDFYMLMVQVIITMKYFVSINIFLSLSLVRSLFQKMEYFWVVLMNMNKNNGFYLDKEFLIVFNKF